MCVCACTSLYCMGAKWRNATHGDALPVGLKSAGEMSNAKDCGGAVTWETFPRRSAGIEGSVRNQPLRHGGSREGHAPLLVHTAGVADCPIFYIAYAKDRFSNSPSPAASSQLQHSWFPSATSPSRFIPAAPKPERSGPLPAGVPLMNLIERPCQ